ncbi:MAG: hypothetical protein HOP12_09365, partial [Candidatus Eisenbacteria bacterium]|nr:hypothetical protein [Candidatus Eisenbacteria bacterium]
GALMGIAVLIRPNAVLLLPGFAVAAAIQLAGARRAWLGPVLIAAAAFVVVLTPWTLRNHHVHGRWFFVASGGGRALWLGNNERTTGRAGSIMLPDSAFSVRLAREPDELAMDRGFRDEALAWMREHPGRAVALYFVRLGSLFALYPETYTRAPFLEHTARLAQGTLTVVVFVGALLGLMALSGSPIRAPILGAIVGFALVNAMFFCVLRYRMPFEPLLLWLAGHGWASRLWRPPSIGS